MTRALALRLLAAFLLVLGAVWSVLRTRAAQAPPPVGRLETAYEGTEPAEPFRAELSAFESALDSGDRRAQAAAAGALQAALDRDRSLRTRARAEPVYGALELAAAPDAPGGPDAFDRRRAWEAARDGFFARAEWFAPNAARPVPGARVDAGAATAALVKCRGDAARLLEDARREAEAFDETRLSPAARERRADELRFARRIWESAWPARVDAAAACLPPGTGTPDTLAGSRRAFARLFASLKSPPASGLDAWLAEAQAAAARAAAVAEAARP